MDIVCSILNAVPALNNIELFDRSCPDSAGQTNLGNIALIVVFLVAFLFR